MLATAHLTIAKRVKPHFTTHSRTPAGRRDVAIDDANACVLLVTDLGITDTILVQTPVRNNLCASNVNPLKNLISLRLRRHRSFAQLTESLTVVHSRDYSEYVIQPARDPLATSGFHQAFTAPLD